MDPDSFASAAAILLGLTVWITGSLYRHRDYSSRLVAERSIYQLSQLRNVLQSLELTALSLKQPIIVSKDLLICLHDIKDALVSLASDLPAPDSSQVLTFENYDLPWNSFNAPGLHQAITSLRVLQRPGACGDSSVLSCEVEKPVSHGKCLLLKTLVLTVFSIERSVFHSPQALAPKYTVDPTGILWQDCAEYVETHQLARRSRLEGTGIWFAAHASFSRWVVGGRRVGRILFCPGKPGSGKTILTLAILYPLSYRSMYWC